MLLVRDFVAHMASEVVKRLVEGGQIEVKARDAVTTRIRQRMLEELTVEDRLNEEVRQILVEPVLDGQLLDRKSTRMNSSHVAISYAGFCLKKKNMDSYLQQTSQAVS